MRKTDQCEFCVTTLQRWSITTGHGTVVLQQLLQQRRPGRMATLPHLTLARHSAPQRTKVDGGAERGDVA